MGILSQNENTNIAYVKWMKIFLEWHGPVKDRAEAFSQKTVESFIEHLKANYSPSSVNQAAAAIKKWGRGWGHNPDITNKLKIEENLPEILSREEIQSLIDGTFDVRDRALLATLYDTGIRVGEAVNLDISDIDFENNWIFIKRRKGGGLPQNIPFQEKTKAILLKYLNERKNKSINDDALFIGKNGRIAVSTVERIIKSGGRMIINKNITPHYLRHAKATHLREAGLAIEDIKDFLGHRNIQVTMRYARLIPSELKKKLPETY